MPRKLLLIILLIALFILSSSFIHAQQRERLATPTNLKFSDGVLTWDPVPNAHRYHIRWRTGNSNWQSDRISRFRAGYRFTRLPLNVTVTMRVRALAGASDDYRHSLWSDDRDVVLTVAASATPTATNTATPSPMATEAVLKDLPRPSGLRHISDSTVIWDAVEGATAYHLRWRQSGGRRRNKVIAETQTRYTIPDLAPGIEYEVKVRALGDGRRYERAGEWSGVVQLTLEAEATNTPTDTPTNTPTDTPTNTPTDTPTDTPTNTPTDTPTNTPTDTPTNTPVPPTNTPTDTPTSTPPPHLPYPRNLRHSLFTVSWDPVPGAVEYGIHVRASVGDQPIRYVSGTSYDIPNPRIGASYFILVQSRGDGRAYAVDNDWSPRYGFSIQPTATPVPPTNTPLPTDTPVPPTATPVPTDTPVPTNTPVPPTATPVPTETPSPVPTPGPVRSLKSTGVLTDAFGIEWKPPLVGVSRKTTYRVEYMDPWSDSWSLAGTTDRLSYYKNEAGWSGEFGIRVRAEGKNGVGPWSRISASVA